MKTLFILSSVVLVLVIVGCASSSNQKISSPLFGVVRNTYNIYNIQSSSSEVTNALKKIKFSTSPNSSTNKDINAAYTLGRGNEIFAIDNQVLIGRDFGNMTSNDVNASASIPLSL